MRSLLMLIGSVLCLLSHSNIVRAEERNNSKQLHGITALDQFFTLASTSTEQQTISIDPIFLHFNKAGIGRIHVMLNKEWISQSEVIRYNHGAALSTATSNAKFLRGYAKFRDKKVPVAATSRLSLDGKMIHQLYFIASSRKRSHQFGFSVTTSQSLDSISTHTAVELDRSFLSSKPEILCAQEASAQAYPSQRTASPKGNISIAAMTTPRTVGITAIVDAELKARFEAEKTDPADGIKTIINRAQTIHLKDLNINLRLVAQHILEEEVSALETTDPIELLKNLSIPSVWSTETSSDLFHLFSGKNLNDSKSGATTLGLAYVGSVCSEAQYRYSLTQYDPEFSHLLFAHEIGHNLGATHDWGIGPSIMSPTFNRGNPPQSFSKTSITQIEENIAKNGECLFFKGATLPQIGTSLSRNNPSAGETTISFYLRTSVVATQFADAEPFEVMFRPLNGPGKFKRYAQARSLVAGFSFVTNEAGQYFSRLINHPDVRSAKLIVLEPRSSINIKLRYIRKDGKRQALVSGQLKNVHGDGSLYLVNVNGTRSAHATKRTLVPLQQNYSFAITPATPGMYQLRFIYPDGESTLGSRIIVVK